MTNDLANEVVGSVSYGDSLQGEVSIERGSVSWNVLSLATIHGVKMVSSLMAITTQQ